MSLNVSAWEKLLLRWSGLEPTGEVRLICAVLADGIVRRKKDAWFFTGGGFNDYCNAVGLNPSFVQEQISREDKHIFNVPAKV